MECAHNRLLVTLLPILIHLQVSIMAAPLQHVNIQNYAARVILHLSMSSSITIHLKSLHWLPVKVRYTYNIACLCYHCHSSTAPSYVTDMLHKSHCTPATLAPAHTPCLFSIDLHTVRQHLVIVHFLLLLLLSGTLFQMMSGVPHHCHHLNLV